MSGYAKAENPEDFGPQTRLELFALEWLKDLSVTRAGRRVGYAESTLNSQGRNLLNHPVVQATITRELADRKKRLSIEADFVLRELLAVASADIAEAFDDKGNLKPLHEIPLEVRKAIAGVETFEEYAGKGEQRQAVGQTRKLKWWDRLKALELLGKYHQLFTDKLEVNLTGDLGDRILKARGRGAKTDTADLA